MIPSTNSTAASHQQRPTIVFLCTSMPPYRMHMHQRMFDEIVEARVLAVITHLDGARDWNAKALEELNMRNLSGGDCIANPWSLSLQWREWRRGAKLIQLIKKEHAEGVICNGYNDLGRLRVVFWCWRHAVPCFFWSDSNLMDERSKGPLLRFAKQGLIRLLSKLTSGSLVCGSLGRKYWEHYGTDPENIFLLPYEPDYRLIEELTDEEVEQGVAPFGLADGRRRLIYSGRLIPIKRLDLLIDAFAAIADERPEWDLLILGDGECKAKLEASVPPQLASRVIWTGFVGDQKSVSCLYKKSDVLVLPSEREPWALVVNEAAAAGLAIVVSDVVGAGAELVRDGVNGKIFKTGDGESLRQALHAVTDPDSIGPSQAASAAILADWRNRADPVEGVRQAFKSVGVLQRET